jgi:signal transduction histidine kinase
VDDILSGVAVEINRSGGTVLVDRPLGGVLGHGLMLRQALENLITNGLKYTLPGRPPEVRIRSELRSGPRRRVWVEDRGIGIPRGEQERLFQPFSRLEASKSYSGTGLGLAIARRALERIGGTIGIVSDAGLGARFYIELAPAPENRGS